MQIIGLRKIDAFKRDHANSRVSLEGWIAVAGEAIWKTFPDVKRTFAAADYLHPYVIFDVGGNNYRLIAIIDYERQSITIHNLLTHATYDKWSKDYRKRMKK